MKKTFSIVGVACIMLAGCGNKGGLAASLPTSPTGEVIIRVGDTRVIPTIEWDLAVTADHAGVTVGILTASGLVAAIEIADAAGNIVAAPEASVWQDLHEVWGWYSVRGYVNGIASDWFQFGVFPNPNFSGEKPAPPTVPPTVQRYYAKQCIQAEDFGAGMSEVLSFAAPAGNNEVTATFYDVNHAPGYQVGQVENAIIGGFGVTNDVPDDETSASTSWTTPLAVGEVRVTGNQGSGHRVGGAVCVEVTSRN